MPSITFWNRLEPRPRTASIARSLAAMIRDPLWMLTRQWQFGEFNAVDAGSPAFATIQTATTRLSRWRAEGGPDQSVDASAPLEKLVASEAATPSLTIRSELGCYFEDLLVAAHLDGLLDGFRKAYRIGLESEDASDGDSIRFRSVVAGRLTDGYNLLVAARGSAPGLPAAPAVAPTNREAVKNLLAGLIAYAGEVYGDFAALDSPAWAPERLEYELQAVAPLADGGEAIFAAHPDRDAEFDWYAFDLSARAAAQPGPPAAAAKKKSLVPGHVRFRGMPNARWWDFESGTINFGAIDTDRREITKLLLADLMLVHSNDWFVIPVDVEVNSLTQIVSLSVRDTFGSDVFILAAEVTADPAQRWTMFTLTDTTGTQPVANGLLLPPSAAVSSQKSDPVEDVRFIRDEMANMVWAIERTVEGETGSPRDGSDRDAGAVAATPDSGAPAIRYEIETRVPEYWIPFLAVKIDAARAAIALERSAMLHAPANTPILPYGRILNPQKPTAKPYRLREEEVGRQGVRVSRVITRSRWTDGSTHLWIARRKQAGRGEGSSGLQFDKSAAGSE